MLAGDGGDELFGGNARYAYQKYFEFYGSVPGWFRRFLLEPAVTASVSGGLPLVRKARSYIAKASTRLPDRLQCDNFFGSTSPSRLMSDHFLGSIDPRHPLETMRLSYDPVETDSWLQRMLAFDLQFTLADDDLRKVVTMCELAGIDVRFPLLDDEIVALASRVPPELCVKGFKLRYFYKNAFRGFLPDEILSKPKHGFGMPFETWFANSPALRELINDNVARLKRRDLLNAKFLDDVMSGSDAEIEAYSHDIHWALLLLELWLERHVDHAASVKT
jgi:asparagine synthase (glutamine-hydrolysing)